MLKMSGRQLRSTRRRCVRLGLWAVVVVSLLCLVDLLIGGLGGPASRPQPEHAQEVVARDRMRSRLTLADVPVAVDKLVAHVVVLGPLLHLCGVVGLTKPVEHRIDELAGEDAVGLERRPFARERIG